MIIAVEGIDGAGKNTLVTAIRAATGAAVLSFPRYDDSLPAQLAADALHGKMGDLTQSPYAMATLFALDREGAKDTLEAYREQGVILLDRYVASNAAYSWARTGDEAIVDWVAELEFERLGLPVPDLQVLLATDPQEAARRATKRAEHDASRSKDAYERDSSLQERTFEAYCSLAERRWFSDWVVTANAEEILARIEVLR